MTIPLTLDKRRVLEIIIGGIAICGLLAIWQTAHFSLDNYETKPIPLGNPAQVENRSVEAFPVGQAESPSLLDTPLDKGSEFALPDTLMATIKQKWQGLTGRQIIEAYKKGSIMRKFPSQFLEKTIEEIDESAKKGERDARTAMKLLTDSRFDKDDNRK